MPDRYGDESPQHLNPLDVSECDLCDDEGYRGNRVCNHVDYEAAAKRGMYLIRQALQKTNHQEDEQ